MISDIIPHAIDIIIVSVGVGILGYYVGVIRTMNKYRMKKVISK